VPGPPAAMLSLDQWVSAGHHPAPQSDYCVPCAMTGGGNIIAPRAGSGLISLASPSDLDLEARAEIENGLDLFLDLSASLPAPTPDFALQALYLRSEGQYFSLLHRATGASAQLEEFATGEFSSLILSGFTDLFRQDRQASLVYIFCLEGGEPDDCFWTSTPILFFSSADG